MALTDDLTELQPRATLLLRSGRVENFEQAVLDRLERDAAVAIANDHTSGPLSSRELTVVRYLASRLTNKEIAFGALRVDQHGQDARQADLPEARGLVSREAVTEARRLGVF